MIGGAGSRDALLSSPGREEELVTISPTSFASAQMSVGELAPVPPVLGVPVPTGGDGEGSTQQLENFVSQRGQEGQERGVQLAPVLSIDSIASVPGGKSKLSLSAQLRSEIEASRRAAKRAQELSSLHEMARRKRERGGEWAKGVEGQLQALQGTEMQDQAKIAAERARIGDLERQLATEKIAHSLKQAKDQEETRSERVVEEKGTVAMLKSELAEAAQEVQKTAPQEPDAARASGAKPKGGGANAQAADADGATPGLAAIAKENGAAIKKLKEKLRRLRLVSEGQYGILYKRLDALGTQLKQGQEGATTVLEAHATLKQGNAMVEKQQQQQLVSSKPEANSWGQGESTTENIGGGFDPERLFGGYHLAGGSHPGEKLTQARETWMDDAASNQHVDPLIAKRKAISKSLTNLALGDSADAAHVDAVGEASDAPDSGKEQRVKRSARGEEGRNDEIRHASRRDREDDEVTSRSEEGGGDTRRAADREEPALQASATRQQPESRAEEGFKKLAKKAATLVVHPEGMHGSVYRHFMHELQGEEVKDGREPMLFAAKPKTRVEGKHKGARTVELRSSRGFTGVGF